MHSFACTQWAEGQRGAQSRPALRRTRKDAQPHSLHWASWKDERHCAPALPAAGHHPQTFPAALGSSMGTVLQSCIKHLASCKSIFPLSWVIRRYPLAKTKPKRHHDVHPHWECSNAVQVPVVRAPWSLQRSYLCINYRLPQRLSNQQFATPAQCYNWSFSRHPPSYLIKPFKPFCILFIGAVKNPRTRYKESFLLFCIAL